MLVIYTKLSVFLGKKILPYILRWYLVPLSYDKLRQGRKIPTLEEACWSQHPGALQGAEQSQAFSPGLAQGSLMAHLSPPFKCKENKLG